MSRSNCGDAARGVFTSMTFLALVAGLGLALSSGGCPGDSSSASSILGEVIQADAADMANGVPAVQDMTVATVADSPLVVTLRGNSPGNHSLKFVIETNPEHGELDSIQPVDGASATVRFTPKSGYAGASSFSYRAWDGQNYSSPATVSISVYPEVQFSVAVADGMEGLTVAALAHTANPNYALPGGTYAWAFDDQVFSGPASSNGQRTHTFAGGDMHTVTLTLTLAGIALPIPSAFVTDPADSGVIAGPNAYTATIQGIPPMRLIGAGESWRYLKGLANTPPAGWAQPAFNDSAWLSGPTGIGYGDNDDATVLNDMINSYRTVYARRTFTLQNPAVISALTLRIIYDDGFVAYLNGVEVARRNLGAAGSAVTRDSEATRASSRPLPKTSRFRRRVSSPAATCWRSRFIIRLWEARTSR